MKKQKTKTNAEEDCYYQSGIRATQVRTIKDGTDNETQATKSRENKKGGKTVLQLGSF